MNQLSMFADFAAAEFETKTAHLPASYDAAIPYFLSLIERNHEAILAGDLHLAEQISEEAHDLALKLNHGDPGILADDNSPGNVLERETRAPDGEVPKWGQTGCFQIEIDGIHMKVDIEGLYGLARPPCPGLSVHAVDYDRPFISETGYRSFLGYQIEPEKETPDAFAARLIGEHMKTLKALRMIEPCYREPSPG